MHILIHKKTENIDIEREILKQHTITSFVSSENIIDCDGLIVWHDIVVDDNLLNTIPSCKWIVRYGTGYDNIDIDACKTRGIKVSNTPTYGVEEVSNFTINSILIGTRNTLDLIQNDKWDLTIDSHRSSSLQLGIIGLGRIGMSVALKAKSLGFDVLFYDPYVNTGIEKSLGFKRIHSLNRILLCDVITIHVPLTDETRNFINFDKIIDNAIVINTSRDGVIDKESIRRNIHRIKCFVTDVDDLPSFKNIIKTPHMAFYTKESLIEMRENASEEMLRLCNNLEPYWKVI